MSEPHFLVTGANGFVGRALVRHLADAGRKVTAQIRRAASPTLVRAGIPTLSLPIERLGAELADVTHVVHVAGDPRFGNGPQYRASNVETTAALIAALRQHAPNLRRLVLVSTIGAVDRAPDDPCTRPLDAATPPHPTSDYGRSKLEAERLVAASGLPFAIVRPAMVVGPTMRAESHMAVFARAAIQGGLLGRLDLPGELSVVHVDDLAAALVLAAEHPDAAGQTYFAAGTPVRLGALFDWAKSGPWRLPVAPLAALLRPALRYLPFQAKGLLYPALVADDAPLRALGWQPRHDGHAALAQVIEREQNRADPARPLPGLTVVTGAASGLGRAMALRLHALGRRLLLVDRDGVGLDQVLASQANVTRAVCDLADAAAIRRLCASPEWRAGPIDELYACAGFGLRGEVATLPAEPQADVIRVNMIARLLLAHEVAQEMGERGLGRIVLVSSSSAFQPLPFMAAYAASNAALLLFGEALAFESAPKGIDVFVACPGGMQTPFQSRAGVKQDPKEKLMPPEAVAAAILQGIARRRTVILISTRARAMSLLARLLPRALSLRLWGRLMGRLR